MLDGYHRKFNEWAMKEVDRGVDIPDPDLGVGFAEHLEPVPLLVRYETVVAPAKIPAIRTIEDASGDGQGRSVSMDQFPNMGYMGEQLGVF